MCAGLAYSVQAALKAEASQAGLQAWLLNQTLYIICLLLVRRAVGGDVGSRQTNFAAWRLCQQSMHAVDHV